MMTPKWIISETSLVTQPYSRGFMTRLGREATRLRRQIFEDHKPGAMTLGQASIPEQDLTKP
jgi:hypothetical protein